MFEQLLLWRTSKKNYRIIQSVLHPPITHPRFYPFFNILFQTACTRHRSHLFLLLPSNHDVFTAALLVVNNQIINQRWPLINRARVHVGALLLTQCVIILMKICHCVSFFFCKLPLICHNTATGASERIIE